MFVLALTAGLYAVPPSPPSTGAVERGVPRNLFVERGRSTAEVDFKIDLAFQQLFHGTQTQTIYYETGADMAYIKDVNNNDIRSEGMSYGMMICAVLNKKTEFDRLWKWAKTYMRHSSGEWQGCFAWKLSEQGTKMDDGPAPDGEEYFATALFFAGRLWNDTTYTNEANAVLDVMLYHRRDALKVNAYTGHTNYFDSIEKKIVFSPFGTAALFTDPSYHLPAFYELWGLWAKTDNQFWLAAADSSRAFFKRCAGSQNSLMPERAFFSGAPNAGGGNFDQFLYDAWRIGMNIGLDYSWWAADPWQKTYADNLQQFFNSKGIKTYPDRYNLDGTALYNDHSAGLVAANAVASLAATNELAWNFVDELWILTIPDGTYRYYSGCIYLLSLLKASGRFFPPGLAVAVAPVPHNRGLTAPSRSYSNSGVEYYDLYGRKLNAKTRGVRSGVYLSVNQASMLFLLAR